ncbi:ABC transporter ATP-binding protein [Flavobacterium agricola]|uniref:ABC transporter ATP-binding protein n=1 Tax=Flavobacterium agricola TaxID=2870839 RepID=A0ABY6M107_9FLAO|nr:ABC transporter ATP-binding protein [Flavobacterium agricola]UYW00898.1 ABC transporter ATP-binding protein [Flavobacterium agricola]
MIRIENLQKTYGKETVLAIDALEIQRSEVVGLIGNNGAGKTTLFSLILDLIEPSKGFVSNKGIVVSQSDSWKKHTAAFLDESFLIGYLTPEEYFYFIGSLHNMNKADVDAFIETFRDFFNDEILNKKKYIRDLSKGNQKKVGIIAAFMGNPEVVILDEPFANLDPTTQIRLKRVITDFSQNNKTTILISSHDLSLTVEVVSRILILEKGRLLKDTEKTENSLQELESFFAV